MKSVDIHEAKAKLAELIDEACNDKPFVISKSGKPLVKVTAIERYTDSRVERLGFLKGQFEIPHDFNQFGTAESAAIFGL